VREVTAIAAPKISVLMPTYNRAALLKDFIVSILNQSLPDFELIVSDNCSTDATPEIVASFSDPRLRYYRQERNIGPFANMNFLIEQACGEYLCIVHDDDVYSPEFLLRQSRMLDEHPGAGMVHCAVYEIDVDGVRRRLNQAYPTTRVLAGRDEFVRYLQGHNVSCPSVMARRNLFRENPFDSRFLCADFLMWMKFALRGDVAYIAEPLLDVRVHADNVTSWLNPMRWHDEFMAILKEGFSLGVQAHPSLADERDALFRIAGRAQGRRFLIAALAAVARGDLELARGYTAVLEQLREIGLPRTYSLGARVVNNRLGHSVLRFVAGVRRFRARRLAESFEAKAARA
jgi:glycosyltransferase involved in cell wall biosynthesis